ncbi:PAS domain-containing protein [Myxococcaceae bacterium GXIMD 01537]
MSESPTSPSEDETPRVEREWLRAVLRLLPVGVFIADAHGRLMETNATAETIWGASRPLLESPEDYGAYEGYWAGTRRRLEASDWAMAYALRTGQPLHNQEVDIVAFDGARRTILNSATPLHAPDGTLAGAVAVNVDITERKAIERASAWLSEVSGVLAESLDWERTLRAVARLATPGLCDACAVEVLEADGLLHRRALAASDASLLSLLEEALPATSTVDEGSPAARALQEGRPLLLERPDRAWRSARARSPGRSRALEALGPRSALILPLTVGPRRLGLLRLLVYDLRSRSADSVRMLAEEFARRAALALENARLYREQQEALAALAGSRSLMESFIDSAPLGMAYLDRELRYVRVNPVLARLNGAPPEAHLGRTVREVLGPWADDSERQLRSVLETGEPVLDHILKMSASAGVDAGQYLVSYFPVREGWAVTGVGGVVADITEQKRVEENLRFLAEATTRMSDSLELRPTMENIASVLVGRVADYCLVDVLAEDGAHLVRMAAEAIDPDTRRSIQQTLRFSAPPDSESPIRRVLRLRRSELVADVNEAWLEQAIAAPEHRRVLQKLGSRSMMMVPLLARGQALGVITVVSQNPARRYTAKDLAFLEDLAWRAALAADNARLFERAEQAVAARDEFVAIATHELRTPLSALHLRLGALMRNLERGAPPDEKQLRRALEMSLRQTTRLEGLLTHLFDVSRISADRLELEREEVDLTRLVRNLVVRLEDALAQANTPAVVHAEAPVVASVDRLRVEQVVSNLLSNAMKYAPGQPIELTVAREGGDAFITVKDAGPGIAPDMQARIFERYQRASGEHVRGSLGLGLYISRQIARAHGGDLTVESTPGKGARFVLRLPLHPPPGE